MEWHWIAWNVQISTEKPCLPTFNPHWNRVMLISLQNSLPGSPDLHGLVMFANPTPYGVRDQFTKSLYLRN